MVSSHGVRSQDLFGEEVLAIVEHAKEAAELAAIHTLGAADAIEARLSTPEVTQLVMAATGAVTYSFHIAEEAVNATRGADSADVDAATARPRGELDITSLAISLAARTALLAYEATGVAMAHARTTAADKRGDGSSPVAAFLGRDRKANVERVALAQASANTAGLAYRASMAAYHAALLAHEATAESG